MARKAKKRLHAMPPLSLVDKLIYWTAMGLLCMADLALLFGPLALRKKIAFADETVIAATEGSLLWLVVPWITFFLMTFILWLIPYQKRKPIFGNKKYKYGPPAYPKIYPLFMKNKPYVWVSKNAIKNRRQIAVVLLIILLLGFVPFPWALYGRDCLHANGSISQYNIFNRQTHDYSSGDISNVEFGVYRYSSGGRYSRRTHYGIDVEMTTEDGRHYRFEFSDFKKNQWLHEMARLKRRYDTQIITYDDADKLHKVILDRDMTEAETELLYALFGTAGT